MYSSKTPSKLRLWWRRQAFHLRQLSAVKVILLLLFFIILIRKIPNPFSSNYAKIPIDQNIRWDGVSELIQLKQNVNIFLFFL